MKKFELNGAIYSYVIDDLISEMKKVPVNEDIELKINSGGGEVFPAITLYNYLTKERKGKVVTIADTLVASAGTIILYAGTEVKAYDNTLLMYHSPSSLVWGNSDDFRDEADLLDKIEGIIENIYKSKTKKNKNYIEKNKDKWLTIEEAKQLGFIDNIITEKKEKEDDISIYNKLVASFDMGAKTKTNKIKMEQVKEKPKVNDVKYTNLNDFNEFKEEYVKQTNICNENLSKVTDELKSQLKIINDLNEKVKSLESEKVSIKNIIDNYENNQKDGEVEKTYDDYSKKELDLMDMENPEKYNMLVKNKFKK